MPFYQNEKLRLREHVFSQAGLRVLCTVLQDQLLMGDGAEDPFGKRAGDMRTRSHDAQLQVGFHLLPCGSEGQKLAQTGQGKGSGTAKGWGQGRGR